MFADLSAFFTPASIALVGATEREGSVGRALTENLQAFPGQFYPINPKRSEVCGIRAWPDLQSVPEDIDLVVIAVPAEKVRSVIRESSKRGAKAAIIITAGFKETGPKGRELEEAVMAEARGCGIRVIGPNCLGLMAPHLGLNATFATAMARPGRIALLSQSGALCTALLDWSFKQQVGFSGFVSTGSMADVGWGDLIRYFGDDPQTHSILIYMESVGDAASFMRAAQAVATRKPIIVIKTGRSEAAARAAASHTGAMTGSDAVLDAAFDRCGVLRVDTIQELFDMADVLAKQPLPSGPRLAIVTNAGGPGTLAVDALVHHGASLAELSPETIHALDACLPSHWSHGNPVDVLGDADPERFRQATKIVLSDPNIDGVLTILTPQAMTKPLEVAQALVGPTDKPVLASWMGSAAVETARDALIQAGIPCFDYPDEATRVFALMWERQKRLRTLIHHPTPEGQLVTCLIDKGTARVLTEAEAKSVLVAAGIPTVEVHQAQTREEAVSMAVKIGFPVVLKLQSPTITHKSDVGGVRLNLESAEAVMAAWDAIRGAVSETDFDGVTVQRMVLDKGVELICGFSRDPQFGPVLLFGSGGIDAEVQQDTVLLLPPLNAELVRQRIQQTRVFKILQGLRGRPSCDIEAVIDALLKIASVATQNPQFIEMDINPLIATPRGVLALDARILVVVV
ncbi:MAG: acetate--CoA ligase family protein [Verrucomicrobiaceae bacterium]|nr:acetate--CoA ligase family protein [Verrucomicrobiaceae bacterium]